MTLSFLTSLIFGCSTQSTKKPPTIPADIVRTLNKKTKKVEFKMTRAQAREYVKTIKLDNRAKRKAGQRLIKLYEGCQI